MNTPAVPKCTAKLKTAPDVSNRQNSQRRRKKSFPLPTCVTELLHADGEDNIREYLTRRSRGEYEENNFFSFRR